MAELFHRNYAHSISVARRILPAQEEFLDAVQSAYLSAFRHFRSFRAEASFRTWINRIVRNQCLMHLRKLHRHAIVLSLDDPDSGARPNMAADSPTPEDLGLRAELERAVADATSKLPKLLNDVFTRFSFSGLSIEATAKVLGLTVPATKTRLFRARSLVQQRVRAAFPGAFSPTTSRIFFDRE
jgi:RNA polymerase sigma-70 factor, ECF subfamily